MNKKFYILSLSFVIVSTSILFGHIDNYLLEEECGSCHIGHGLKGEPMLAFSEEEFCYQCHGSDEKRNIMKSSGKLAQKAEPDDIEAVFKKIYHHPVKEGMGHSPTEKLPGLTASSVNHSECVDCHNPHQRIIKGIKQTYDVPGYSLSGKYLEKSLNEYEICLKCHATLFGLKSYSKNMQRVFSLSNRSQHPVTMPFTKIKSVSLTKSLSDGNTMNCSDCHTNDDSNGPRGPHGSRYRFLLSGNYNTDIYVTESQYAYQFCYSCHDRTSILSNESFPLHKEHIVGDPFKNIKGTSCYTCHASHSSENNEFLIDFNLEAVTRDDLYRQIEYRYTGNNTGECYLKCHEHSHSPGKYSK